MATLEKKVADEYEKEAAKGKTIAMMNRRNTIKFAEKQKQKRNSVIVQKQQLINDNLRKDKEI
jgi:hypothetical protein